MSTSAAKRRRIEEANHTLSKPFRSPFKTPNKSPIKPPSSNGTASTPLRSTALPIDDTKVLSIVTSREATAPVTPSSTTTTPRSAPRTKKTYVSPATTAALNADVDIARLLRTQRDFERQLREVKESLETAEQAHKIETESFAKVQDRDGGEEEVDGELVLLIDKWKRASRQASEELFGSVRDRVNRMGGPRAWKEAQKKQLEYRNSWDRDDERSGRDGDGNEDENEDDDGDDGRRKDAEKQSHYEEYAQDVETANEKSQRTNGLGDTDSGELPGQEDEFTMAMMLRTLNVDLAIIGYDREQERWVD